QHRHKRDYIREHGPLDEEFGHQADRWRSIRFCRTTKKAGTNKTAMHVDASIPLATAIPRERRALAPAPRAKTSGNTPRMKVNEVIAIGRKRTREASMAASKMLLPAIRLSRALSTIKIAFFADNAISSTSPICT